MKKYIATILLLSILLLFSGCMVADSNETTTDSVSTTTETTTQKLNEYERISLTEKYLKEIDEEYKYKLANNELSNYEISLLSKEYATKWSIVADDYYNKIITESDDFIYDQDSELLKSSMINMKKNWDNYAEQEKEDYHNLLISYHGGGTIVGPDTSKYEYELEKQWALKVLTIAERLYID